MGVVTICSGKTAGVSTLALAIAARWPGPVMALLVEADPAGGDLAARFGLLPAPGLGSAAAHSGHGDGAQAWQIAAGHAQRLPLPAHVLLAPASFVQASAAVRAIADSGLLATAGRYGPMVADLGRLAPGSPALPLAAAADVTLVVTRPRWDEVAHAAASVEALRGAAVAGVALVLRGRGPLSARQISDTLGVPVLAQPDDDRVGARVLRGDLPAGPAWTRLGLARTGRGIAATLLHRIPGLGGAAAASRTQVAR
jgi:hypothetical protein